jgi:hypothetical protein
MGERLDPFPGEEGQLSATNMLANARACPPVPPMLTVETALFTNTDACVLIEAHDEWQVSDRRYLSEGSMAMLNPPEPTPIDAPRSPLDTPAQEVIDTPSPLRHSSPKQGATRRYFHHPTGLDPGSDRPHAGSTVFTMTQFFSPLGRS